MALLALAALLAMGGCSTEPVAPVGPTTPDQVMSIADWDRDGDGVVVIAHRGLVCCFPENTIAAIRGSFEAGLDAVEIDVALTADGVPVLMHDPTVDRTTTGSGLISALSFEHVRSLNACKHRPRPCSVPTLEEALEAASPYGNLVLDFKIDPDTAQIRPILLAVQRSGMRSRVIVGGGNMAVVHLVRWMDRTIPIVAAPWRQANLADARALAPAMLMTPLDTLLAAPEIVTAAIEQGITLAAMGIRFHSELAAARDLGIHRFVSDVGLDR
jgi:glycerophosphoryl diester phosphodiesterase